MDADQRILRLGYGGFLVAVNTVSGALSIWKAGQKVSDLPWSRPLRAELLNVTATSTGFIFNVACQVWTSMFDGTTTQLGAFSGAMPGTSMPNPGECCAAAIGPDGKGYVSAQTNDVIGTCELGGANTALFTKTTVPAQNWNAAPPVVPPTFEGVVVFQ